MNILAIETSCDETSAAVVQEGRTVLSNVIASQTDLHARYGGVVPELASRQHVTAIIPVLQAALEESGLARDELDAIAAVIIGGTLLTGGRGTIMGSILGLLIFTLITNLFILNGLNTSDQLVAKGLIIVIAVLMQRRGLQSKT